MCGICGAIDFGGSGGASSLVRRMTPTMFHRGPDDEGYLDDGPISLGMRRLSIIDLEAGHQPIFNEDGSVGVVLNGEIYNFRELRKQLGDLGHRFRTRSDSEMVAHAYEEWDAECVQRFEGMFAIAVWDGRGATQHSALSTQHSADARGPSEGTLFLARDRLGIKPLYYTEMSEIRSQTSDIRTPTSDLRPLTSDLRPPTSDLRPLTSDLRPPTSDLRPLTSVFLFASEVRTLLASGVVPRRLSRSALHSYLLFGSVSEPMTLVEGVLSLPPGHRMTIPLGAQTTAARPEAYWNIAEGGRGDGATGGRGDAEKLGRGDGETGREPGLDGNANHKSGIPKLETRNSKLETAPTRVRELLEESVRRHLIADVPVGVFLSSGIDSTALAALASREVSGVHTFTVAFPEKEFSEAAIARRTAKQFGTTHDELMLSGDEMLAQLGEAVSALDQPSMDGINTYFVSWAARQAGLKVALSGLGGDEVFGGYSTFRRTPQYQRLAALGVRLPDPVRATMATAMSGTGDALARGDAARKLAALWSQSESLPHAYFFARALFTPSQVAELLTEAAGTNHNALWWHWLAEGVEQTSEMDHFSAVTCLEARSYLVSTLLRDTDSMSMAHSLEVRVPFLHHPLVEFVTQLPARLKLRSGTPKALLVAALEDLLPSEVINQTKRGFTFPWATWLRGPLKEKMERGLSEITPALREVLKEKSVRAVWQSYLAGRTSWSRPWSLYVLNEWVKRNLG
jgi:asparagine synthase (glutamine-hydrolysing)